MVKLRFCQNIFCQPKKATLDSRKLDIGLLSPGSNGTEFADKTVMICVLFHSVCCLFLVKSGRLLDRKKSSVLLTI